MTVTTTNAFDLQRIQLIRKWVLGIALLAAVALAFVSSSPWVGEPLSEGIESVGLGAIVISIVGRAWCSLYIGGRKKAEIVSTGPYSISRNPLYVFSYFGAFGVGAQTGSFSMGVLFVVIAVAVFHFTIRQEEAWLTAEFGEPYKAYMARTPRCGPAFSKWQDNAELTVRPQFFLTTIRDGLVFLLAVPIFEGVDWAQAQGWLPVLIHLP
ncbi:methyltransferase family protein [Brevundimonas subvibrioides]|uniref:Isoprenylcysteine carboxyl methyltransferase n=1 Tax=Brevundimonas subvibrioides (strain ATCC 15264 / DSM 4735 / LMG 14903 / NBRC 16000 / CB 81) TaxID=633149 RepID=D9QGX4_BRESC|nr:isoprenylcysteine carboxylmethyltransferase family protein [Brevundimonas subvibrioides]ADL00940.1 Isoprenylcysteine carboxyl methyltransferase [Brevundimonas subvibrioides ATCC 15264]